VYKQHYIAIITTFESKTSSKIIALMLKYGVLVYYKRGSLGIDNKYFEGLLVSKFAAGESEEDSGRRILANEF
jgi:hypothetical protein